jgi:hypothetical protein
LFFDGEKEQGAGQNSSGGYFPPAENRGERLFGGMVAVRP